MRPTIAQKTFGFASARCAGSKALFAVIACNPGTLIAQIARSFWLKVERRWHELADHLYMVACTAEQEVDPRGGEVEKPLAGNCPGALSSTVWIRNYAATASQASPLTLSEI
jgi:hypothetical protein